MRTLDIVFIVLIALGLALVVVGILMIEFVAVLWWGAALAIGGSAGWLVAMSRRKSRGQR